MSLKYILYDEHDSEKIFSQPYKISHYSFLWVQSTQPNRHKTRNIVFAFIRGQIAVKKKMKTLLEFKLFLAICNLTFPISKNGFHLVKTCKKSPKLIQSKKLLLKY